MVLTSIIKVWIFDRIVDVGFEEVVLKPYFGILTFNVVVYADTNQLVVRWSFLLPFEVKKLETYWKDNWSTTI